jgi:hypothetical protein
MELVLTSKSVPVRKQAGKPKLDKSEILRRVILGELNRVFRDRWGHEFPEGDQGALEDLEVLLRYHALHPTHGRQHVKHCIETRAPWLSEEQKEQHISDASLDGRYLWLDANELRERVWLRNADRERLKAWHIPPCDLTQSQVERQRKNKKRTRDRLRRAKAGAKSRSIYLRGSLSALKPWEREGISRRTWYRRRSGTTPRQLLSTLQIRTVTNRSLPDIALVGTSASHVEKTLSSADLCQHRNGTVRKEAT